MPRKGGGGGGGRSSSGSGSRRSFSSTSNNRAPSPPASPSPMPSQPGLFRQMATTAGGVAAGSVIGSAIIGGVRGGGGGSNECVDCERPPQQSNQEPCQAEFQNFLACTQRESDINSCDGFNTLLKECRRYYDSKRQ